MRVEKRKVVIEKEIFIAEDGKEFDSKYDCDDYEYELKMLRLEKSVDEKLRLYNVESNWVSIANPDKRVSKDYRWFKIENREDLELFCKGYKQYHRGLADPGYVEAFLVYPDFICLVDYPEGPDDPMWFSLSEMVGRSNSFLNQFGMEINIKKND